MGQGIFNKDQGVEDSLSKPVLELQPAEVIIDDPPGRFIEYSVKVLNRGSGPLKIERIKGSCSCSSGKAVKSPVYPMEVGEIILWINTDGLNPDNNMVKYTIETNAENSPATIYVTINNLEKVREKEE
jgi:hypothetical protein